MLSENLQFTVIVLVLLLLVVASRRLLIGIHNLIQELRYELRRDRLQRERIAREQNFQSRALRRGTRKIDGRSRSVSWNEMGKKAGRSFHADEAAHEVFGLASDDRSMDVRIPWGWPGKQQAADPTKRSRRRRGLRNTVSGWFRTKQVVDEEIRARRLRALRMLVEDRYGRSSIASEASEIEWSKPQLPEAYVRERELDQVLAWKASQDKEPDTGRMARPVVVSDCSRDKKAHQKASGG